MKVYLNAFLQKNLGDDLFVYILMNRYKNHDFYTITTDKTYRNMFDSLHILDIPLLVKVIKRLSLKSLIADRCDLCLTLGGSMYIENPRDKDRNFSLGKNDHYILGVNFGPYKSIEYFNNIKGLFNDSKDVCFREQYSYNLFKDLTQARVAPDIVFSLSLDNIKIDHNQRHAVISVIDPKRKIPDISEEDYLTMIQNICLYFVNHDYKVTLMSFCEYEGDENVIDYLLSVMNDSRINRYDYKGNIKEALELLGSASIIAGSRFHANIIGMIMDKTVIPIIYSDKTKNVLDDLNFKGLMIDLRKINEFNTSLFNNEVLSYKLDVSDARICAHEHFKKLDERLR